MATMKEIALACNLSTTAVSKALRGHRDISEETKEKVKKTAKEMGYSPNAAAVRLRTNRSHTIGVILKDANGLHLQHDFFSDILEHFVVSANASGYTVIFLSENLGKQNLSYLECTHTLGCDGIFSLISHYSHPQVHELMASPIPAVSVDYSYHGQSSVHSDNDAGMGNMVAYAHKMGHRDIAFIHGEENYVTQQRLASFHRTCGELGIITPDDYIISSLFSNPEAVEQATYRLLQLKKPPTFIFYPDDLAFIGGRNALEKMGLSYPKDISVAGYDGQYISQVISPKLMTWRQNTEELGRKAWEILKEAIESPKTYSPKPYRVEGELLPGGSVKNLNP